MSLRLFVGGLSSKVDDNALKSQFGKYVKVLTISLKDKKDPEGNILTRFAYITIDATRQQVHQCVDELNGTSWKGSRLRVEQAKESFIDKLKREREQNALINKDKDKAENPKESILKKVSPLKAKHDDIVKKSKKKKKKRNDDDSSTSESDEDEKQGVPMFSGTKAKETETVKNEEEMMVDFKNFSSVWGDSSDDDTTSSEEEEEEKRPQQQQQQQQDLGIFTKFNQADDQLKSSSIAIKKASKTEQLREMVPIRDQINKLKETIPSNRDSNTMIRYDPNDPNNKSNEPEVKTSINDNTSKIQSSMKYVKVSDDLNFKMSSSFSLLNAFKQNKTDDYIESIEENKTVMSKDIETAERPKKSRMFFLQADDQILKDGVTWMCQELKDDDVEHFSEARLEILEICKTKVARLRQAQRNKRGRKVRNFRRPIKS